MVYWVISCGHEPRSDSWAAHPSFPVFPSSSTSESTWEFRVFHYVLVFLVSQLHPYAICPWYHNFRPLLLVKSQFVMVKRPPPRWFYEAAGVCCWWNQNYYLLLLYHHHIILGCCTQSWLINSRYQHYCIIVCFISLSKLCQTHL